MADKKTGTTMIFNRMGKCWDFEFNGIKYNIPMGERELPSDLVEAITNSTLVNQIKVYTDAERKAVKEAAEKAKKAAADAEKASKEAEKKAQAVAAEKARMESIKAEVLKRGQFLAALRLDIAAMKQRIKEDTEIVKEKEKQAKEIEAINKAAETALEEKVGEEEKPKK